MPRGNYFEFLKEEAAGSGLERKTVQRDATFQIIDIISGEIRAKAKEIFGASYLSVRFNRSGRK